MVDKRYSSRIITIPLPLVLYVRRDENALRNSRKEELSVDETVSIIYVISSTGQCELNGSLINSTRTLMHTCCRLRRSRFLGTL